MKMKITNEQIKYLLKKYGRVGLGFYNLDYVDFLKKYRITNNDGITLQQFRNLNEAVEYFLRIDYFLRTMYPMHRVIDRIKGIELIKEGKKELIVKPCEGYFFSLEISQLGTVLRIFQEKEDYKSE